MSFRVYIEKDPISRDPRLFILHDDPRSGRSSVLRQMVFADYDPMESIQETCGRVITREAGSQEQFIQALVNAAWDAGYRPAGYGDVKESLAAQKAHLDDMRAIVAHALQMRADGNALKRS